MNDKNLQKSDFRLGLKDDDGSSMPETLNALSNGALDSSEENKPEKIKYTEDDYFLRPILLDGEARKKFCKRFKKSGGDPGNCKVYLWNKLSDPNVHPNDYLSFESPNTLTITHVITTCKGIFALDELLKPPVESEEAFELVSREMRERSIEFRTEEMDEDFELTQKEMGIGTELPEDFKPVDESIQMERSQDGFDDMKIKEVFKLFQSSCCKKINDGVCHKRHYLVGKGKVVIEGNEYEGIHIYLYPDLHYNQVSDPEKEIQDSLYLQFQTEKELRGIQFDQMKYIVGYMNEFREILKKC